MSGSPDAFAMMVEHLIVGGRIAMLGLPAKPALVDGSRIVLKLLTVRGVYGREMFETWRKMVAMLQSGLETRKVITYSMSGRDFRNAFEVMGAGQSGKIGLDWTNV